MLQENIFLKEVLETMKTLDADGRAVPFSISVRTLNRYSKTGGKLKKFPKAKMVMKEENPNANSDMALRIKPKKPTARKNPNHQQNKTRNIKILPQGNIITIHIRYIIEFNGKKVIY